MASEKFDSYVICTSPRSGSTMLCNMLDIAGVAGNPASYFHRPSIRAWLREFELVPDSNCSEQLVLEQIFKAAINKGSANTGMFGLRVQRKSFDFLLEKLSVLNPGASSNLESIQVIFGRTAFIHLTREDKVEQAVSFVRAEQSGLWHKSVDGTELERQSPPKELYYDPVAIQSRMEEVTTYDLQWESWFASEGVSPLRIAYETLSACPNKTLAQILEFLSVDDNAAVGVEATVAKLADRTSQMWVDRFKSRNTIT